MVKQLNLLKTGQIIPTALHVEMEQSYLEYAMSVIVGRALPDVRDGLKPVHRRILYAMHELGLTPDRPYRKCARVVGDVLGKYHPHGDQAVYDALVRMVQEFSSRYPLLSGHGNFGSIDNDPPAAMRYTETRLASIGNQGLLRDISEAIVDFTDNFDNSQQEPVVLPALLPILLLNGCSGIAVGMATNVPPHNLTEVVDGLIALIDQPQLPDEKLWEIIKAPDFPTGGELIELNGVHEAYKTGRGIISVRGVTKIEKIYQGKRQTREKTAIIVTELPYQVNKAAWIEKVADLVNQGRLEGIADLRDESDREGIRVVVELKRDASHEKVLQQLYQLTSLQNSFGVIILALVDNQPRQLSLRQLLDEFLKFREQTLTRKHTEELTQAQHRLHLVEGLLVAINQLDTVISVLRDAPDGTTAKMTLQTQLQISETQADSILAMPMRRITGLERQKIQSEHAELQTRIIELQKLLGDRQELMKALKKELRSLKRQFGDARRTKIVSLDTAKPESPKPTPTASSLVPSASGVVMVTENGGIYWQEPEKSAKKQHDQNLVIFRAQMDLNKPLVVINDQGKAYPVAKENIPHSSENSSQLLLHLLPKSAQRDTKRIVTQLFLSEAQNPRELLFVTDQGRIKKMLSSELEGLSNRGLMLIKLKETDRLAYVCLIDTEKDVAIATKTGRIVRYNLKEEKIPMLGRSAQGITALHLRHNEQLTGCITINPQENVLLISELGYGKRLPVNNLRICSPGDLGTQAFKFINPSDNLVGILSETESTFLCLTNEREIKQISVNDIPILNKDSTGELVVKLKQKEKIIAVYHNLN